MPNYASFDGTAFYYDDLRGHGIDSETLPIVLLARGAGRQVKQTRLDARHGSGHV